ncbi:TetR/AcrR family transcriptional regulator [Pseudomonas sp. R3-41]
MRLLSEVKRDAILQAAAKVFQEEGFEAASMAGIAAQIGGSKSTLYRYYSSKEELFAAVSHQVAKKQILPSLEKLLTSQSKDLPAMLREFGETSLAVVASESSIKTLRIVISESGRSDIGNLFVAAGPKVAMQLLTEFFKGRMEAGVMRKSDPEVATRHLIALLDSETVFPLLMGVREGLSSAELKDAVHRAIDTFLSGYSAGDSTQSKLGT